MDVSGDGRHVRNVTHATGKDSLYSTADLAHTILYHLVPGMHRKSSLQALTMILCFSRQAPALLHPTNQGDYFGHVVETCGSLSNEPRVKTGDGLLGVLY